MLDEFFLAVDATSTFAHNCCAANRYERPTGSNAKLSGSVLLGAHSWFVSPMLRGTLRGKLSVRSTN